MRKFVINGYIIYRYTEKGETMNLILNLIQKCLIFEKEPQKVGLCQIKEDSVPIRRSEPSIKNKNVKLSDLMRRAS